MSDKHDLDSFLKGVTFVSSMQGSNHNNLQALRSPQGQTWPMMAGPSAPGFEMLQPGQMQLVLAQTQPQQPNFRPGPRDRRDVTRYNCTKKGHVEGATGPGPAGTRPGP